MGFLTTTAELTHEGAMAMLEAAIAKANEHGQPQCIVIVDANGQVLAELRMTGAKFLSRKSALAKAMTAASIGAPSNTIPENVKMLIGLATNGSVTGLPGGMPIRVKGILLGGIGVGSGTGEQDMEVAKSALEAIGADC